MAALSRIGLAETAKAAIVARVLKPSIGLMATKAFSVVMVAMALCA